MSASSQDLVIVKLDRAKHALAEAKTIQQTKKILDVASTAEIYAKRQQLGDEVIAYAYAIKIEALRLLGEMLGETPDAKTGPKPKQLGSHAELNSIPTLADLGIGKKTSMIAQRLANLPQAQFEQIQNGTASLAQVLRAAKRANTCEVAWSIDAFEQRFRVFLRHEQDTALPESNLLIVATGRRILAELEEGNDPELRDAVAIAKDELEVYDAERGNFKIFDGSTVIAACKSLTPPFYKPLTTAADGAYAMTRRQVDKCLDAIGKGKLPTKRDKRNHSATLMAIKDLPRTSPLARSSFREDAP